MNCWLSSSKTKLSTSIFVPYQYSAYKSNLEYRGQYVKHHGGEHKVNASFESKDVCQYPPAFKVLSYGNVPGTTVYGSGKASCLTT